jgi:hypothetical protein
VLFSIECNLIYEDSSLTRQEKIRLVRQAFEIFVNGIPKDRPSASIKKTSLNTIEPSSSRAERKLGAAFTEMRAITVSNEVTASPNGATSKRAGLKADTLADDFIVRLFPKKNLRSEDAWELSSRLPNYKVALGRSDLVGDTRNADTLFVTPETVSPNRVMEVVEALNGMGIKLRMIQSKGKFRPKEIQIGTIAYDVFNKLHPLDIEELRKLARTNDVTDFWRYARNGWICDSKGIGKTECRKE